MSDLITQLCKLTAEILQDNPHADLARLVAIVKQNIDANSQLGEAIQSDRQLIQINEGNAKGFQTLVTGGIANIGIHLNDVNSEMLQEILQRVLAFELTLEWMWQKFEEVKANAGARYTPEIHVDLPESWVFEGLGRTDIFFDRIKILYGQAYRRAKKLQKLNHLEQRFPKVIQSIRSLNQTISELIALLQKIDRDSFTHIPFTDIASLAKKAEELVYKIYLSTKEGESFSNNEDESFSINEDESSQVGKKRYSAKEIMGSLQHDISQILDVIRDVSKLATQESAEAANRKVLLLMGDAGTGKTHLFCDIAKRRLEKKLPTIILLGQHFINGNPWTQIIQQLQLPFRSCDDLLNALDAVAQSCRKRALIMIDALNEGDSKDLWQHNLSGILKVLENYPRIGLAISCRTSYERRVIPKDLTPDSFVKIVHRGFSDSEYIATKNFFEHYGIERPRIPLLVPEFSNPLFLKIFCQGLQKRGLTTTPQGIKGVTAIFNFFIDTIHEVLCHRLDYDDRTNLVQESVNLLAKEMAETGNPWLERKKASDIVNTILIGRSYQQSLFANLLSEGLLSEDLIYQPQKSDEEEYPLVEVVKFPYERFSDHLIVRYLTKTHLDMSNLVNSFMLGKPLGDLFATESHTWEHSGWIEALSVQLPEKVEQELVELSPRIKSWEVVKRAFLQSLIWRNPNKITTATKNYLNEIYTAKGSEEVYDVMLTIAADPNHLFNANFLHQHLIKLTMSDRDSVWSIYLSEQYEQRNASDRLIDWAWESRKDHISDESIELCAIALSWFLTTSHRYVRDRATKALVSMLHSKPHILSKVIERFLEANDLYVLERLYAIAYGVAMISGDTEAIGILAGKVYNWVFANSNPIPHILLRDYARGVIEIAHSRKTLPPDIEIELARPPYKTSWISIPDLAEIQNLDVALSDIDDDRQFAYADIEESVMGFGDFARYIIGTNSNHFEWSCCRLGELSSKQIHALRKQKVNEFEESLTSKQKKSWGRYKKIRSIITSAKILDAKQRQEYFEEELTDLELDKYLEDTEKRFLHLIGKRRRNIFEEFILPYLNDSYGSEFNFDLSLAQRWIFKRVFDLGWTVEQFGYFDRYIDNLSYGREANKSERIGKKYQWIAYHEFLAYVADNFEFVGDRFENTDDQYDNPCQINSGTRDVDPSLLLRKLPNKDDERTQGLKTWWQPVEYIFDDADKEEQVAWITQESDCPDPRQWIEVIKPTDESNWLTLEGHYGWTEKGLIEEESYASLKRNLWFQLRSYLVPEKDPEELLSWLSDKNLTGRWMPESRDMYGVFVGEFPWAKTAIQYTNQEEFWENGDNELPVPVIVTAVNYYRESTSHDCSIDESISALMPSAWLIQKMGLHWSGGNFRYVDSNNDLIALDPSVEEAGAKVVLISKEKLVNFLEENKLVLIWTVLGERQLVGGFTQEWHGRLDISCVYKFDGNYQVTME
jgi:DNA replication protein DnaC